MGVSTVGTRRLETFSKLINSHCQKRKKSPFLPFFLVDNHKTFFLRAVRKAKATQQQYSNSP